VFLPENLRKQKSKYYKGSIMSIYSTSQFLGIACGGVIGGWLYSFLSVQQIFLFEIFFIYIWFLCSLFLSNKFFTK